MSLSQYCTGKVKFISYDGSYPNLCAGVLVLEANGKIFKFAPHSLGSGGSAYFTNDYQDSHICEGDWDVSMWPDNFPEDLKLEAVIVINDNVDHGCCGGCL